MKITNKLELRAIERQPQIKEVGDMSGNYDFIYDTNYWLNLDIGFRLSAFTRKMLPVFNFSYEVKLKKYDKKKFYYRRIIGYDSQDGSSTKKVLSDQESRSMLTKLVHRHISKTLEQVDIPVIMQGPLNTYEQKSQRYANIDQLITAFGYTKIVVSPSKMKNFLPNGCDIQNPNEDVYWFFTKNMKDINDLTWLMRRGYCGLDGAAVLD